MRFLWITLFVLIVGCAASGPKYVQVADNLADVPESGSRIVIFRTRESKLYIARKATISLDNSKIGATAYGGFHYHDTSPGKHRLRADMWDAPGQCELEIDLAPGQVYFFQVDPRKDSFWAFAAGGVATGGIGLSYSIIGGLGAAAAESYGQQCAGAFRLYPVDGETARSKIIDLNVSN